MNRCETPPPTSAEVALRDPSSGGNKTEGSTFPSSDREPSIRLPSLQDQLVKQKEAKGDVRFKVRLI